MLVTSRAALHLSGECEFPVLPLAVPDLTQLFSPETLMQSGSVRLFVLRTQAIQPAFHVTPANARAIAEICVRLDGLPLAIELAATRIKLLRAALLHRLSHRLDVLTGGAQRSAHSPADAAQHAAVELRPADGNGTAPLPLALHLRRRLHARGCRSGVPCGGGRQQASSVLEGIASLLDKSLVQQTEREGEEPQLVMLETLREFGLECLERQGELEVVRRAHARYYLALVEAAEPHLFGPEQLPWLDRLERDLDNLRAILQAATSGREEEVELALRWKCLGTFLGWARVSARGTQRTGTPPGTSRGTCSTRPPQSAQRSRSDPVGPERRTQVSAGRRRSPGARAGTGGPAEHDRRHDPARNGHDIGQTRLCRSAGMPGGGTNLGHNARGSPDPRLGAYEPGPPGVVPARRSAGDYPG